MSISFSEKSLRTIDASALVAHVTKNLMMNVPLATHDQDNSEVET
jgi:hypothetical protein